MSVVFTLLCVHPIGASGESQLLAAQARFLFELAFEAPDTWRSAAGDGLEAEVSTLAPWLSRPVARIVRLTTQPAGAALAAHCADALISIYGGVFYDDTSWSVSDEQPGAGTRDVQQVVDRWSQLAASGPARDAPLATITVRCARTIDHDGRNVLAGVRGVPFSLTFEDGAPSRATIAGEGPFRGVVPAPRATVVQLMPRNAAAVPVTMECALVLSATFGGTVHDSGSPTTFDAHVGSLRPSVRDVASSWIGVVNAHARRRPTLDRREHAQAKKEWETDAASDPSVEANNDWSDI